MDIPNPYLGNYKLLAIAPVILILISLFFVPQIRLGVEFKGGTLATVQATQDVNADSAIAKLRSEGLEVSTLKVYKSPIDKQKTIVEVEMARSEKLAQMEALKSSFFANVDEVSRLEAAYQQRPSDAPSYIEARKSLDNTADGIFSLAGENKKASMFTNINVLRREVSEAIVIIGMNEKNALYSKIGGAIPYESISVEEISASLSTKFIEKASMVVVVSTILIVIAVFLIYRTVGPSIAVLAGAGADIIIALGAMGLFGIPLTLASFAALLMLVGFSLDTDILLTMRVIKRKEGTARERAYDAMKTGMTMSLAAMVAFGSLFALSYITHIGTYYEISSVALAGLAGDLFATWGINAVLVLHYAEKMEKENRGHDEKPIFSSIFAK